MGRVVYVNGNYVDEADATVSIFDRGLLFGDGIYEVSTVLDGKLVDNAGHLARMERSLKELQMPAPCPTEDIVTIQRELISRNNIDEGLVYLQITRGSAGDRDFLFPAEGTPATLFMFTQAKNITDSSSATKGLKVVIVPDIRWRRRDIKTVMLLPSVLAKQAAKEAGVDEAWMLEDGRITEGTSNNAFIVTEDGRIITRQLSNDILHGITRKAVMAVAKDLDLTVVERSFTPDEAYEAREAFITSASAFVMPIVKIDDHILGNGVPGPIAQKLRDAYIKFAKETAD